MIINVQKIKDSYPEGTTVELISMDDFQAPPPGTRGTANHVDDAGTIFVSWGNGSSLGLIPGIDKFRVIGGAS